MENNTEQIGIRTTLATKMQWEAVEGVTSSEKLENVLSAYTDVKNAPEGQIIDQSIELLDMLKVNLAKLGKTVNPVENNEIENNELREKLDFQIKKYKSLMEDYQKLVLELETQKSKNRKTL